MRHGQVHDLRIPISHVLRYLGRPRADNENSGLGGELEQHPHELVEECLVSDVPDPSVCQAADHEKADPVSLMSNSSRMRSTSR